MTQQRKALHRRITPVLGLIIKIFLTFIVLIQNLIARTQKANPDVQLYSDSGVPLEFGLW